MAARPDCLYTSIPIRPASLHYSMTFSLRHLLVAVALLFAQYGAQMHAVSHVGHDLAVAQRGEKSAPPLSHPVEQCLAFHAVGSALPSIALSFDALIVTPPVVALSALPLPFPPRIEFDSRAPPALS